MSVKSEKITIRVTPKQLKEIEKKVSNSKLKRSEYIRNCILKPKLIDKELKQNIIKIYKELRNQGNNLNQIARILNSHKNINSSRILKEIENTKNINQQTQYLIEKGV